MAQNSLSLLDIIKLFHTLSVSGGAIYFTRHKKKDIFTVMNDVKVKLMTVNSWEDAQ